MLQRYRANSEIIKADLTYNNPFITMLTAKFTFRKISIFKYKNLSDKG